MDIKGFKAKDGTVHKYDYASLANRPSAEVTPSQGADGGYYTPSVSQPEKNKVQFAFTPSKPDMPAVEPVQVELPAGQGSGDNPDQSGTGLSQTASNALITLLKNATYVSGDMYAELKTLADELGVELSDYISATGIVLSESALSFSTEETQTLTATLTPDNASDTVIWSSSDEAVATVVGGVVTPVASGDCTITATAGSVSAKCNVNVKLLGAPKYRLLDLTRTFVADTDYFETTSTNHLKFVTTGGSVYGIANADTYADGDSKSSGKGANPTTEWFTIPAGATCEFYILNGTGSGAVATAVNSCIKLVKAGGSDWTGDTVAGLTIIAPKFISGEKVTATVPEDTVVGGLTAVFYATGTIEGDLVLTVNGVRYL